MRSDFRQGSAGTSPALRYAAVCRRPSTRPRRWLVTGAAGFIGGTLADALLRLGCHSTHHLGRGIRETRSGYAAASAPVLPAGTASVAARGAAELTLAVPPPAAS